MACRANNTCRYDDAFNLLTFRIANDCLKLFRKEVYLPCSPKKKKLSELFLKVEMNKEFKNTKQVFVINLYTICNSSSGKGLISHV